MVAFWTAALALSILLYVLLDGFDLGVGMLFPFAPGEAGRRQMLASIAPVWDGNETWLVIAAAILFGAFPLVYSLLLSAFYLPLLVMLAGLILRGVAFEYRYKTERLRWLWDGGFVAGSYAAGFIQGATVGAVVQGLAVEGGRYAGGPLAWASPFALLCGFGLCIGYALVGSCWLARKTSGVLRGFAMRVLPRLVAALLIFLAVAFVHALLLNLAVLQRWIERPFLVLFPDDRRGRDLADLPRRAARRRPLPVPCGRAHFHCRVRDPGGGRSCLTWCRSRSPWRRRRRPTRRCASCSGGPGCSRCRSRSSTRRWSISSSATGSATTATTNRRPKARLQFPPRNARPRAASPGGHD